MLCLTNFLREGKVLRKGSSCLDNVLRVMAWYESEMHRSGTADRIRYRQYGLVIQELMYPARYRNRRELVYSGGKTFIAG